MKKKKRYSKILDECLVSVMDQGDPLQQVIGEYPAWAGDLVIDIKMAQQIKDSQHLYNPRPDFVPAAWVSLRGQLFNPAASNIRLPGLHQGLIPRMAVLFVILIVAFIGGSAIALAAGDALPGNSLYPFRRTIESVQLFFTLDPQRDAEIHLGLAQAYLVDYAILSSRGNWTQASIALQQYDRHVARTSRILLGLTDLNRAEFDALFQVFNRIYLQDLKILMVLSPGEF